MMRSPALIVLVLASVSLASAIDWQPCPLFTSYRATSVSSLSAQARKSGVDPQVLDDTLALLRSAKSKSPRLGLRDTEHVAGTPLGAIIPAQCAMVSVPLYHDNSRPGTIQVFVKKLPAFNLTAGTPAQKSIIFYQGGPGGSSEALESVMYTWYRYGDGSVDTYTMDHRGVGRSTRLGCTRSQAETTGSIGGTAIVGGEVKLCGDELRNHTGLESYSYSMNPDDAAGDIYTVLNEINTDSAARGLITDWYVYGVSYGTMLVQRYLALYPNQPKAVILDGVVTQAGGPGKRLTFDYWSVGQTDTTEVFFDTYCAADAFCLEKLGVNPWRALVKPTMDAIWPHGGGPSSFCAGAREILPYRDDMKSLLGSLIVSIQVRHLVAATLYRLARCSANDLTYFSGLVQLVFGSPTAPPDPCPVGLSSDMVYNMIASAELYDRRRPLSELQAQESIQYVGSTASLSMYDLVYESLWPLYTPYNTTFNRTAVAPTTPVLLFNGDLDAQTPHKYAVYTTADLKATNPSNAGKINLYSIPGAPHGTILYSQTTTSPVPCVVQMIMSYMRNNASQVDSTCLNSIIPVDFMGSPAINKVLFDTEDIYDGTAFPPAPPADHSSSEATVSRTVFTAVVVPLAVVCLISLFGVIYLVNSRRPAVPLSKTGSTADYNFNAH